MKRSNVSQDDALQKLQSAKITIEKLKKEARKRDMDFIVLESSKAYLEVQLQRSKDGWKVARKEALWWKSRSKWAAANNSIRMQKTIDKIVTSAKKKALWEKGVDDDDDDYSDLLPHGRVITQQSGFPP